MDNEKLYLHTEYCEIVNNHGVLIFADFEVHLNHETKNPTKYNFPIDCLKPRIQEPMAQCILPKPRKLVPTNKSTFTVLRISPENSITN